MFPPQLQKSAPRVWGMPLVKQQCPPFLEPRLRLFLSADIVGSTSLKQTRSRVSDDDDESVKGPVWFSAIQGFYFEAAQAFLYDWAERRSRSDESERLYGEPPEFWKSIGDEVLFTKLLTDHRQLATTLICWFAAVKRMRQFLKDENSSLDVKCTAWIAGFPYRNREVAIGRYPSLSGRRVENYYKESGDLLNSYYDKSAVSSAVSVDYIGPSIDTGFRLTGFSSSRKMVVSVDVAYLLSMTSFDGEVERIDLYYEGSHTLKGVMGGSPYPVFWINMSGESSLAVKEDRLKLQTICNTQDLKEYCDAFYQEYSSFTFRPFINGEIGQTLAKAPSWYNNYHSSLVKNFNLPDNEYEDTDSNDENAISTEAQQKTISEFLSSITFSPLESADFKFAVGDRVMHGKFGVGTVTLIDGNKVTATFDHSGERRVLGSFLKAAD